MKTRKSVKTLNLRKSQVKAGVRVSKALGAKEVAWRKFNYEVLSHVRIGRKPVVISEYGKPMAIVLPLAE